MDGFLVSLDFSKSIVDPNLYYYSVGDESLILITYSESLAVENTQALTSDFHKGSEYDTLLLGKRSMTECKSIVMDLKKKIDVDSRRDQSTVDWIIDVSG